VVRLATGTHPRAGTDDALYVGVSGTLGGREFPLDVERKNDFERDTRVKYLLGEVWEKDILDGAVTPSGAKGGRNDPVLFSIGFAEIDRVYLRKQTARSAPLDDAFQLDEIEVVLYGEAKQRRVFRTSDAIWLGVAFGGQVWLAEVPPDTPPSISRRS